MRGAQTFETGRARQLRRSGTAAEAILWARLRGRRVKGFKFLRQVPIGHYFVDFVCREEKFIIEVDGATHSTEQEMKSDARRSAALAEYGYRILRVTNEDIVKSIDFVLETILAALERRQTW